LNLKKWSNLGYYIVRNFMITIVKFSRLKWARHVARVVEDK